nr:copper resistance CopC family protein [Nakamurella flavida]
MARLGAVLAVVVLAALGLAGPAAAHNVLTSSNPTDGSVLDAAPQTVTLTFDQPVQNFEPVVVVTGPDGTEYQTGTPTVLGTSVEMSVGTLPVAGAYAVAYRIVSTDGHPVQGQLAFELSAAAVTTGPSVAPTPESNTASSSTPSSSAPSPATSSAATSSSTASSSATSSSSTASSSATSSSSASSAAASTSAAPSTGQTTGSTAVTPAASSGGLSGWIWAALVVAALLVVTAVVLIARRPRRS